MFYHGNNSNSNSNSNNYKCFISKQNEYLNYSKSNFDEETLRILNERTLEFICIKDHNIYREGRDGVNRC